MRFILVVALMMAAAFSGCLNEGLDTYSEPVPEPQQQVMPERTFEPVVTFEVNYLEFEQGDNVVVSWEVSDLHDYPFPMSFIDWTVKYSGAANFVAEGDGDDLPGSYERVIYKEAYHKFIFTISDGQEFDEVHEIVIKVGEPADEVIEIVEEVEAGGVVQHLLTYWNTDNSYCVGLGTANLADINAHWMDVDAGTWGQDFEAYFTSGSGWVEAAIRWVQGTTVLRTDSDLDSGEFYEIMNVVPEGATRAYFYSCGGNPTMMGVNYWTGHTSETLEFEDDPACKSDFSAIFTGWAFNDVGHYVTEVGGIWSYAETNGIPGLQRGEGEGWTDPCANSDLVIF